ncbi:MAG: hypothetical protein KDB29_11875 [Planctomycetes bacterium]|nr:hypothetical protein [Planctomycetota bacterium]
MEEPTLKELWQARVEGLKEIRQRQWEAAMRMSPEERLQAALELCDQIREFQAAGRISSPAPSPEDFRWRERMIRKFEAAARG